MNRDRYILKRNEYDLLMAIEANTGVCPIRAVAGISQNEKNERCCAYVHEGCEVCVQSWLNEGGRKMYIDGKWLTETEANAYVKELKAKAEKFDKAKELLKAAVEDIVWLNEHTVDGEGQCLIETATDMEICLACPLNVNNSHVCGWKHQVEALALIGEDGDTNG